MTTPQPAQATPSIPSDGPSTYEQRFTAAVAVICGVTPPATLVCDWINKAERHDDLQQWVGSYAPGWVQNIAVLDAAHQMADQPTEGGDHEPAQQATQADVTDGIRPEDFTVDVVVKPMGGFAPVNTQGVRVTHKPTGISVTCDAARSQHTNRHQAFEKLSAILALRPERVPMTGEQWTDVLGSAGPDLLDLAKQWSDNKVHVYQVVNEAEKIVKAAVLRGITAHANKETP